MTDADALRKQIDEHRRAAARLEAELRTIDRPSQWFPEGFYIAYYVLTGAILGLIAAWITLGLNIIGAALAGEDPLKLLRVYSTIIGGAETAASRDAVVLAFAVGLHTSTGIACGTPIHVIYSRFFPRQSVFLRLVWGAVLGVLMWLVNFYGVLSWLQPLITGEETSYIVANTPWWVAALSHIAFASIVVLLQPLALFDPSAYAGTRERTADATTR